MDQPYFVLAIVLWVVCCSSGAIAQEAPAAGAPGTAAPTMIPAPPPPTRLEQFEQRTGTLIVRGYTDVATLRAEDGATVRVLAVELSDLRRQEKALGLAIEVHRLNQ